MLGYAGEPYLEVRPDGVYENRQLPGDVPERDPERRHRAAGRRRPDRCRRPGSGSAPSRWPAGTTSAPTGWRRAHRPQVRPIRTARTGSGTGRCRCATGSPRSRCAAPWTGCRRRPRHRGGWPACSARSRSARSDCCPPVGGRAAIVTAVAGRLFRRGRRRRGRVRGRPRGRRRGGRDRRGAAGAARRADLAGPHRARRARRRGVRAGPAAGRRLRPGPVRGLPGTVRRGGQRRGLRPVGRPGALAGDVGAAAGRGGDRDRPRRDAARRAAATRGGTRRRPARAGLDDQPRAAATAGSKP